MTRSRPYKKDDNAHVEQKNWTHIRQCFGYERHDNPEVVEPMNALVKGAYGQLLNYFHASLKLDHKERKEGRMRRIYGAAQTPLARVLASAQVTAQTKQRLRQHKASLNPFALKQAVDRSLKEIAAMRRAARQRPNHEGRIPGKPFRGGGSAPLGRRLRRHPSSAPPPPGKAGSRGIDSHSMMLEKRTVNQNKGHWVTPLLAQRSPLPGNSYFWRTATRCATCCGCTTLLDPYRTLLHGLG